MTTKKCGDCIHADICKQLNGGWFSRENIAYCKGFKDKANYTEVVRCKDCKWYSIAPIDNVPYCCHESGYCGEHMKGLFFCACGERKDNE